MKNVVLLMCMAFMVMGCSTPVKAIPARGGQVVVVERHRHKKPKKVVVVLGTRVKARPAKSVVVYYNRKYPICMLMEFIISLLAGNMK